MTTTPPTPPKRRSTLWVVLLVLMVVGLGVVLWFSGVLKPRPKIAVVTGGKTPYWDMVVRGASDSARKYRIDLTAVTPPSDEPSQTQAIRDLIGKNYDGVAISVLEPVRQADVLAALAAEAPLVTFDSDSPVARRLCFVGTDNYEAGRLAAQHVRAAVADGGEVVIAVGSLEKTNAQQRRQGLIDELTDRPSEPNRAMDPVDAVIKGPKYTIVATLVDGMDPARATALAADALKKNPNVRCFVGLFAYNAPSILEALERNQRLGQVQVVGFDVNDQTLAGIEAGHVYASIMQDPYSMGYTSVRILGDVARGDRSVVPLFQVLNLGCEAVTKENVAAVRENLSGKPKAS